MTKSNEGNSVGVPANPQAFPVPNDANVNDQMGMTLRDYFASNAPTDEVQELYFRHLSRLAQEQLTGIKYPVQPHPYVSNNPGEIEFQLAEFKFKCAVNAAIRFMLADAMLKARWQS